MYLSYSGDSLYRQCPRAYYFQYVGKVPLEKPVNRVHMLYGDAVGKIFEQFYKQKVYLSNSTPRLMAMVEPTLQRIITNETRKGGVFDWAEKGLKPGTRSLDEVRREVEDTIPRGLTSLRLGGLASNDPWTEVDLTTEQEGHLLAGRADFMMRRAAQKDLVIVDGKGSRYRGSYTDPRQLRFYAMLHWLRSGTIVDGLGFLYWRFEPGKNIDWTSVTRQELEDLRSATLTNIEAIELAVKAVEAKSATFYEAFAASTGGHCKLCKYASQCPEGTSLLQQNVKGLIADAIADGVEDGNVSL